MSDAPLSKTVAITNQRGLHARASAKFVQLVAKFDANVTVSKDGNTVSGRSIMGLMMLGASVGTSIDIAADGPQAEAALAELVALVDAKFHEEI